MKQLLRPVFIVVCLSLLLFYVYQQSKTVDISPIQKAQHLITLIEFNESNLERDMLKIRNGELTHFDTLKYELRHLMEIMQQLELLIPADIQAFAALQKKINDQSLVIEQFMSDQAVLSNSLRYLPTAIDVAIAKYPEHEAALLGLHRDLLDYLRGSSPKQLPKIKQQLLNLQVSGALKKHIEHVFVRNQRVLAILAELDAAGIDNETMKLNKQLDAYTEAGIAHMKQYQLWMFVLAALLILYIGWVVWRQTQLANRLRKALMLVEKQQKSLDEHAIVTIADPQGNIIYANDKSCAISGYSRAEMMGGNHRLLNSGLHPESFFERMWHTITAGKVWHGVIRNQRKDGSYYWVETSIVPFMDEHGEPYQYVSIRTDITKIIDQEEEGRLHQKKLEHAQRLESLGVLAGGIAHDFNNLLTAIMGNAGLVERTLKMGDPSRDKVHRVIDAAEKAASLCKQMLAYSGKGHFIIQSCDMSLLAEEMAELLQVSIDKNVVIKYELAENLPAVEADVAQMHQVIMNLITNANEATEGHSGVITLSTGWVSADRTYLDNMVSDDNLPEGDYVYLEVSDNGCGMDKATINKVFDPFFTTKFTGRGLGMSALHGIVRGHQGAIRVYSEFGSGTTVKVLLPASESVAMPTVETNENEKITSMQKGTALIVDDEEMIRELAGVMLREMGFEILTASNGLEAVKLYPEHINAITLVLLDMSMPKMDGEETFRELRKMNPDVCVVLSSGYNEQEATERFKGKGLAGFVQKPYLPDALEKVVLEALG